MVDVPVPDIIAPRSIVLFCGINPGLLSAATKRHFARPGNRFWKALHLSGFTPQLLHPSEQEQLRLSGLGITNFVMEPSASAASISQEQYKEGARTLVRKVRRYTPHFLAILGIEAYRVGFNEKKAQVGLQSRTIGATKVWLLPNPSGLNAHYSLLDFVALFNDLRIASGFEIKNSLH